MRIIKTKTYEEMSAIAAGIIGGQVLLKPNCVLGLATGSSPIGAYKDLVKSYEDGILDFSEVRTVNLDEYCGLDGTNPNSYRYFMNDNLFDHVNIDKANTHVPNGQQHLPDGSSQQRPCRQSSVPTVPCLQQLRHSAPASSSATAPLPATNLIRRRGVLRFG